MITQDTFFFKVDLSYKYLEASLFGEAGASLSLPLQDRPPSTTGFHNCRSTQTTHKVDPESLALMFAARALCAVLDDIAG